VHAATPKHVRRGFAMSAVPERREDPQWDLALEIAGKLWLYGDYVVEVAPAPTQHLVDLQWAAHQAGRILGVKTIINISSAGAKHPTVAVSISFVDPEGRDLRRAQDGLDALLRSVRAHQSVAGPSMAARRPRHPH
jgi:hypothetical protein